MKASCSRKMFPLGLAEVAGAKQLTKGENYMGERMTIHDKRLLGNPPAIAQNTFQVDANWELSNAFLWVGNYARSKGGLDILYVMCHGLYGWEENRQLQASIAIGGYGLQLCKQGLTLATMNVVATNIRSLISNIVIFACGAASAQSNNWGTGRAGDGQHFCKELAKRTRSVIYAADRMQVYTYYPGSATLPLDFGRWEGTVYRFDPDGSIQAMESSPAATQT